MTVGPLAVRAGDPIRFGCVDCGAASGGVVPGYECVPGLGADGYPEDRYEDDWSAFGAALLFVRLVGAPRALAAALAPR